MTIFFPSVRFLVGRKEKTNNERNKEEKKQGKKEELLRLVFKDSCNI